MVIDKNNNIPINKDELIARDFLAVDRTVLANERTFLAYIRTSFTLLLAGLSILHFFHTIPGIFGGIIFLAGSGIILTMGVIRFKNMNNHLQTIKNYTAENSEAKNTVPNSYPQRSILRLVSRIIN